jgi:hypothetical protein
MNQMMTRVTNMRTGLLHVYSLPPNEAVQQAYKQYTLHDWNTWQDRNDLPLEEGRWHWYCGDYAARKSK